MLTMKYYYNKETGEIVKEDTIEFKVLDYLISINNNLKNDFELLWEDVE